MQNLFIKIENEKTYSIAGFARRKDPNTKQWETEIAYSPDGSPQIYIQPVVEFFSKFVPHNCWATATEEQKDAMRGGILPHPSVNPTSSPTKIIEAVHEGRKISTASTTVNGVEAEADYRPIPRSGDGLEDGRY
jgi:hypothetical protein